MKQIEDNKTIDMIDELTKTQDFNVLMEESHYRHTMHDFVELIVVYGYDKVIGDLRAAMGAKEW